MVKEHSTLLIAMGIHRLLQIIQVNLKTVVYIFSALLASVFWEKISNFDEMYSIHVILCISCEVNGTVLFKISCSRVQIILIFYENSHFVP